MLKPINLALPVLTLMFGFTASVGTSVVRSERATSLSLQGVLGFNPNDILLESLESKTCFDMENRLKSAGTKAILSTCGFPTPSWNQLFTLQDLDGQHFLITNKFHKCLALSSPSQQLASSDQCSSDNARFYLDNSADGQSFLIRQKNNSRCIAPSAAGGTSASSEVLKSVPCDRNDPRQFWRIFSKDKPRRFAPHPSRCQS